MSPSASVNVAGGKCVKSSCEDVTGAAAVISIPLKPPRLLFQADNYFQHSASVSKVELFHLVFIFWWPVTVNVAYCSSVCVRVHVCAYVAPALVQKHRSQPFAATS